jgi:ketosteroid isomerase-like protein
MKVKGLLVLAPCLRADDTSTLLSLKSKVALETKTGQVAAIENFMAGVSGRNVTEMASLMQNLVESQLFGDGVTELQGDIKLDSDIADALKTIKQLLLGDIQHALMKEHHHDQSIVDQLHTCWSECALAHQQDQAQVDEVEGFMLKSKSAHNRCREDVKEVYVEKIQKCNDLDQWIASLECPACVKEECVVIRDPNSRKIGDMLQSHIAWATRSYEEWIVKHKACAEAVRLYSETDEKCDRIQGEFETDACSVRQAHWTACNVNHMACCKRCSVTFDAEVNRVECAEKDRKIDWSATKKIECYIDVLMASPSDEELEAKCKKDGKACINQWREQRYSACKYTCIDVDVETPNGEYLVVNGVNTTHRGVAGKLEGVHRCTSHLDIHFPAQPHCAECPPPPVGPCEEPWIVSHYSEFDSKLAVPGLDNENACHPDVHQKWWAYSRAECRPCPMLIGKPGPSGRTVHSSWDNHFAAFGKQDLDMIMEDYTEASVLESFELNSNSLVTARGKAEIREFFKNLFAMLHDTSGLTAPVLEVGAAPGQVYLVWTCPTSGIKEASDSFFFDENNMILRQNIVWQSGSDPASYAQAAVHSQREAHQLATMHKHYRKASVQAAWDNHFSGFAAQNVEMIMQDYTDHSELRAFDHSTGVLTVANGLSQIQTFFEDLFALLSDTSGLTAPVVHVTDSPASKQVYLVWACPTSGIESATDSFLFGADNKITRQNIVFRSMRTVKSSWDNHFAAFGKQDLDMIMEDYTEASVLESYELSSKSLVTATGKVEIRDFFENLFSMLHDTSGLTAPVLEVSGDPAQVYLVWTCPTSGIKEASDSFFFDADNMILRQNIVWQKGSTPALYDKSTTLTQRSANRLVTMHGSYHKDSVQGAWDNHFSAFGAQNVEAVMQDYTEESELRAFDHTSGVLTVANGLSQIQAFFEDLFAMLSDTSGLTAPVVHVTDSPASKQVYLVWACPTSGIESATDSFLFGADNKITRQNIVFTSSRPAALPVEEH